MNNERKLKYMKLLQMALRIGMTVTWRTTAVIKSHHTFHPQVEADVARDKRGEGAIVKGGVEGGKNQGRGISHSTL